MNLTILEGEMAWTRNSQCSTHCQVMGNNHVVIMNLTILVGDMARTGNSECSTHCQVMGNNHVKL